MIKATESIYKAPGDDSRGRDFVYRMSFDSVLPSGVALVSATISATAGLNAANAGITDADTTYESVVYPADRTVEFDLYGGTAGSTYTVTVTATCTNNSVIVGYVDVVVE